MKVMWITNFALPDIAESIGLEARVYEGWLVGISQILVKDENIELVITCPQNINKEEITGCFGKIKYYAYPQFKDKARFNDKLQGIFEHILEESKPDIIHIMGTEFPHALSMVNACERLGILDRVVISIQGLVSVYAKHFMMGLPWKVQFIPTIRDVIKKQTIYQEYSRIIKRGDYEKLALKKTKNIIGRTDWDYACSNQLNPARIYYFNNETLRPEFYKHTWELDKCERHSIFVSQGSKVFKGLHYMLEALSIVRRTYPDAKLYLAGSSNYSEKETCIRQMRTRYENYIFDLINAYSLQDAVVFCGTLNEQEMCNQYLKAHVFVSPSTIENSPNSLGEAMILGMPSISSDVGGVNSLMQHNVEGYIYQVDAPYMLAYYISRIFQDDGVAMMLSKNAKKRASETHNGEKNAKRLIEIYTSIKSRIK